MLTEMECRSIFAGNSVDDHRRQSAGGLSAKDRVKIATQLNGLGPYAVCTAIRAFSPDGELAVVLNKSYARGKNPAKG